MTAEWTFGEGRGYGFDVDRDELVAAIGELSEEEKRGLLDGTMGWKHPGRVTQRVIAGLLFAMGSIWAVLLVISLFLIVGIVINLVFVFGWLIYGGWFYVMTGRAMSVSLRFFWMASIVVHGVYGWLFSRSEASQDQWNDVVKGTLETGLAWWIPMGASVVALGCEFWARSGEDRKG